MTRVIAFFLPQYHPIPENDAWWGGGFTEWTNVVQARPLFRGHYQPHLPSELGFYDLRLAETRAAQAALAAEYGLDGFCYYHYWFHGRRLLELPVNEMLASGQPDFPFCLCWANESWTRAWDGRTDSYLIEQNYSDVDDLTHIRWLIRNVFADRRYLKIDGRPVFLVYRASELPDSARTTTLWRAEARSAGLEGLYLCRVESFPNEHADPELLGFDAAVEFQPDWLALGHPIRRSRMWRWVRRLGLSSQAYAIHRVYDYSETVGRMLRKPDPNYLRFPCVTPSWDNTPRRSRDAVIFTNSTPEAYEHWLSETLRIRSNNNASEDLVFINAWNEWGEGNHLEPCQRWGRQYLEATRRAIRGR